MSSKPFKIFAPNPRGTFQPVTGRNVQYVTHSKKSEIGEGAVQRINNPFMGYSPMNESNLSHSQASQFNPDMTRKLIRQEMQKQIKDESGRNDINILKTEMKSLKEFVEELKTMCEEKEQIKDEVTDILEEYKIQTARNLREVIKKFDENIKKDIAVQFNNQFLPVTFVDELDKQFGELEDRIQILETKTSGSSHRLENDPVVLAQTIDLRLKKTEREAESFKKTLQDLQEKLASYDDRANLMKSNQILLEQKLSDVNQDIKRLKAQFQKETKKTNSHIDENVRHFNLEVDEKLKKLTEQLNKKISETSSNQIKQFLVNSNNLAVSATFDLSKDMSQDSSDKQISKPLFRSPSPNTKSPNQSSNSKQSPPTSERKFNPTTSEVIDGDSFKIRINKQKQEKQKNSKNEYLIDEQNFLLDNDGNYITDGVGQSIKLSEEQIQIMKKSNMIKFVEN